MVGADGGSTRRGRVARSLEPDTYTDAHTTAEAAASHTHAEAGPRRVVAGTIRRIAVTVWWGSSKSRDGSRQRQDAGKSEHDLLPNTGLIAPESMSVAIWPSWPPSARINRNGYVTLRRFAALRMR